MIFLIGLKNERLLIIAPHADDEVLGCYGLMEKIKNLGFTVQEVARKKLFFEELIIVESKLN